MSAKKLVAGVSLAAGFGTLSAAFVGGLLWGFAFGAEAAVHQTKNLRRVAVCDGERGCEWSYHRGFGAFAGEPVASLGGNYRYYLPFERLPLLGRTRLGKLRYDLAEPLPPWPPLPPRPPRDG